MPVVSTARLVAKPMSVARCSPAEHVTYAVMSSRDMLSLALDAWCCYEPVGSQCAVNMYMQIIRGERSGFVVLVRALPWFCNVHSLA